MKILKFDFHVHTTASSDGMSTPRMAVNAAIKRGLDGIAITDHNTIAAVAAARAAAPERFIIIPGVEYSTDCGHVLSLFCEDLCPGGTPYRLAELAPFVHERGGLLVLAHPFQGKETLPESLFSMIDGIETINARDYKNRRQAEEAAQKHGLFMTGGSDGHCPPEIGIGYTECPADMDLREALRAGYCNPQGKAANKVYWAVSRIWKRIRI